MILQKMLKPVEYKPKYFVINANLSIYEQNTNKKTEVEPCMSKFHGIHHIELSKKAGIGENPLNLGFSMDAYGV